MNRSQKLMLLLKNIFIPDFLIDRGTTIYNEAIEIRRTLGLGIYITVGGLTQSGWVVETIWREVLKYGTSKKLINTSRPGKCLILGLGGGSILKVLENFVRWKMTAIDIDPVIVSMGKKYLFNPQKNTSIKIIDAYGYVKRLVKANREYDLIIVDLYHGKRVPKIFENDEFLIMLLKLVGINGVVIINRLYSSSERIDSVKFGHKLERYFAVDYFYPRANLMLIGRKKI